MTRAPGLSGSRQKRNALRACPVRASNTRVGPKERLK
jgi:hypothetical protein